MDNPQLVNEIKEAFQAGKRRDEIHKELELKGWQTRDIDLAIYHIQREALQTIPGLSRFFAWYDDPKTKEKLSTPKMTAILLAGCFGILVLIFVIFNFLFDPFSLRAKQRDQQRETDLVTLRDAINQYNVRHHSYPATLVSLQPEELRTVPKDPLSGEDYHYNQTENGGNFELCVSFEVDSPQCVAATPIRLDPSIQDTTK